MMSRIERAAFTDAITAHYQRQAEATEHAARKQAEDKARADALEAAHNQQAQAAEAARKHAEDMASGSGDAREAERAAARPCCHWATLYADALYSVLRLLSLAELTRLARVDRRSLSTVMTMPSLQATHRMGGLLSMAIASEPMESRLRSRMARHVASFGEVELPSMELLHCLAARMPWLTELHLAPVESWSPVVCADSLAEFAPLRQLHLTLSRNLWKPSERNAVLAAVGRLRKLDTLSLRLPSPFAGLSFAPLVDLPALRTFALRFQTADLSLSDDQLAELRSMSSVCAFTHHAPCKPELDTAFLARMLQPGHSLAWTTFPGWNVRITEPLAAVLGSLYASLQSIEAYLDCSNVCFLAQLPHLTSVTLQQRAPDLNLDDFLASISQCTQIRTLGLSNFKMTSAQMQRLLPAFPHLSSVTFTHLTQLESLRCFNNPTLASSLTRLSLSSLPACPTVEVCHLLNLRSLRDLWIVSLESGMVSEQQEKFAVRSARFPQLARKNCQ